MPKFYNPAKQKPLEKSIEAAIGRYAMSKGCLWWKFTSPMNRSVPDRWLLTPNGHAALLEVKREGQKPTLGQTQKMQEVEDRNGLVGWVDNVEDGKKIIDLWCSLPKVSALTEALRETLSLLNYSDTSFPEQEGWWSHEKAREMGAMLPRAVAGLDEIW